MISTEEQHELEFKASEESVPLKLDQNDLEHSAFPSEIDRAYVVEFLQKQFGDMWSTMPEGEKKEEIERNVEQGLAEVRGMMGEKWDSLSKDQKRDLFHTLFVERAIKLDIEVTAPRESSVSEPEVSEPQPEQAAPEPESAVPSETAEEKKEFPGLTQWVASKSGDPEFTTDWSERRQQYLAEKKTFEEQTND